MNILLEGMADAFKLIVSGDRLVLDAAWRSTWITSTAILLASGVGLPTGMLLARKRFFGRGMLVILMRALMALPTVFVGVICFAVFSRQGILGPLEILYTPWAIVAGEFVLALPIVISLICGAVQSLDPRVGETIKTLGAGWWLRMITYLREARAGISLAILTAFARCVTELGIAMMVGGNLKSQTRTLATATALETGKGEFVRGLAMGLILLLIAMVVMSLMTLLNRKRSSEVAKP